MARHIVLGGGGIGRSVAHALISAGEDAVLVSRSDRDLGPDGATAVALDVTDETRLADLATGARTIVNALNPSAYTHWERDWPPMAKAVLAAAERSGGGLITVSNLYGYGLVDGPITERTALRPNGVKGHVRVEMWEQALAAHAAGRARVSEVRASDYIGPATLGTSLVSGMLIKPILKGRSPWLPMGRVDAPHSWTYDGDVAALVRALALSDGDADWGRAWHVPTDAPATFAQLGEEVATITGAKARPVHVMPRSMVTVGGLVVPLLAELRETRHQFERPFVLDSSDAQARFELAPTPRHTAVEETVAALRAAGIKG